MRRGLLWVVPLVAATASATPSGKRWLNLPVTYRVYAHTSITGISNFQGEALPRIEAGFAHWQSPQVDCTTWAATYGGNFTSPIGQAAINPNPGSGNNLIWLGGQGTGTVWPLDSATLALTTVTAYYATGEIIDADIEFNNDQRWKVSGATADVDVESIATHEAGHFLGLAHSPNSDAVMYANYVFGEVKTALSYSDTTDVCGVYPKGVDGGTLGAPCTSDSQCSAQAHACRERYGVTGAKICTTECTGETCPAGYSCQTSEPDGGSKACLVRPGAPDLCRFCASGNECSTSYCVTDDTARHNWCSAFCRSDLDCGSNYRCDGADGGSSGFCAPLTACTGQCTSAYDCAPGYLCVGNRCEASGEISQRCELTGYCASCLACVGGPDAYCESCCGTLAGGGMCDGCGPPPAGCAAGTSCQPLSNNRDEVCYPTLGGESCTPCSGTNPCKHGLQCIAGLCHYDCNPQHPGVCGACYPYTQSTGSCACPGEVAPTGYACGPNPLGGFVACSTGDVCVGSPPTCHATCSQQGATCTSGGTCQVMSDGGLLCAAEGQSGGRCSPPILGACNTGYTAYAGRCYEPCNPASPTCPTCTVVSPSLAVCACSDQENPIGSACGAYPDGGISACAAGARCADGTCRQICNPVTPNACPTGTSCKYSSSGYACQPTATGGGADSGAPDGGSVTPPWSGGCGCDSTGSIAAAAVLLALFAVTRRKRGQAGFRPVIQGDRSKPSLSPFLAPRSRRDRPAPSP